FSNTELKDLLHQLQVASGRDLSSFTEQWLRIPGVNTVRPDYDVDENGNFTRFDIVQTAIEKYPTLRTHRLGIGIYTLTDGKLVRTERLDVDIHDERTPIAALVGHSRGDLVLLNDGDLTYAKVRLDDHSMATLIEHIDALSDPLARALCWSSAWDMCRDAEMKAQDYVTLVGKGLPSETDLTAVTSLLRQATTAAISYTTREARQDVRDHLVAISAAGLRDAEPGSDHQVAYANGLAAAATKDAADLLEGWLNGEEVPEGLDIDQGVRWRLLIALAGMGRVGEPEITAELQRDNTISGSEQATGARAAMPTAEAKQAAWQRATTDDSVPNETYRQLVSQFIQPDQAEALSQ
ncbi:MAG: M1 family metallopeptidase, partial [Cutibacterium avidum]|nr:M1 family metallopeptidase [Cutibacterium avidum]